MSTKQKKDKDLAESCVALFVLILGSMIFQFLEKSGKGNSGNSDHSDIKFEPVRTGMRPEAPEAH